MYNKFIIFILFINLYFKNNKIIIILSYYHKKQKKKFNIFN